MTTNPVVSPVQGEAVEPVADTEAVETVRRVPEESYTITTECRANRGDGGAWDEAAARLRVVYNAQLARFGPAAVYRLEFHREPAPGVPRYVYDAARDSRPVSLPTAREGETDGGLMLPANPLGTAAAWADFDWRRIAGQLVERLGGQSLASVACERIADAVESSS